MPSTSHKPVFPKPADAEAAKRLRVDFSELGEAQARFAASAEGAALLDALGGNAPYLAELACRDSEALLACMTSGVDAHVAALLQTVRELPLDLSRREVSAAVRRAKRQAALAIAIADIGGLWPLEKITLALSDLAGTTLRAALRHLLLDLHEAEKITLPFPGEPERGCGFVALGLGKLGAHELNYSSDIDLVLLYDPDCAVYPEDAQSMMARLARDITTLLAARDEDGYVFRVDLRLRPDPSATPPVVALPTALAYYESQGRTWERAAFSKARPIAGDIALGEQFLAAIRSFIWRKYLDFAAISEIHEMKRQIDAQTGGAGLLGLDVKRGRGGIREIEFIVQTLGLVWGGQEPALRIPPTLDALPAMARAGHLPERTARELAADYRKLRQVEHRLQMVGDRQTHALPTTQAALEAFTIFLGEPGFLRDFPALLARVHGHFRSFFDAGAEEPPPALDPGTDGPPPAAFTAKLQELGFADPQHIAARLREWTSGRLPALRAERARELLEQLLPHLFGALGALPEPDKAFALFDTLLSRQRAGVQLLSLFTRHPALLQRVAAVLGAAPALAEQLAEDPQALEGLLSPSARFAAPKPVLRRQLAEAEDLEQATEITRRFVRQEEFHLSVATLEGRIDADAAGRLRTALAESALSLLLPRVLAAHKTRYGRVPGARFAVVAMGKAGAGEMLAGSDLDLMLIYDYAPADIAPTPYFVRLSHAFTAALTAQGKEGQLYHIDMRLRPSGNHGPVAVALEAFRRYHAQESWTWERLALTRARVLAATPGFAKVVEAAIRAALEREQSAESILKDTADMRDRLAAELPPRGMFDVKALPGGMMEVVFVAQALQLVHGPRRPEVFQPNTAAALRALERAELLDEPDAGLLLRADHLWRTIQGVNRITGLSERASDPPTALAAPLLRATGTADFAELRLVMAQTAAQVQACFNRIIRRGDIT
ncbi:bifunctional [glutamine synthetase] adenylyltransferase/[glutamine synthetase]-adenylyl-L-tyrosine phosphorylase [Acidocella sp. KAb 2-4]|uniref:bifunctional [glutamine synthetase] adenylyltransferase/[glutamine synthetase]-adenylyl-L-tyrosine phosphorylase n=1 Tax=Acidocella sp. KAb 2-4 TaxID=2885158 RepID=UPI001D06AD5A|nr:bifunctional [glutamine synthetase] adenylyltransferase/[glutamine synthetase]-adenylyl-L-tyrosine phosphorylase [Acidocella sp. KAb 2-4]MCB5943313.1 bifunctional [glutamine synthetase] adenylyltransferase/[glutamine synthetase]-adenylyl-L-tyrosine phosphorylase [Acidocella sp. KAb 2-4]